MFDSRLYKWKDLSFHVNGVKIIDFSELFYDAEQEAEEVYGEEDEPLAIQTGNRKYFGQVKMYETAFNALNKAAIAQGYRDLMDVPWTIVASYKETIDTPKSTDTLPQVRFTNYRKGMEQNAKSMPIPLNFKCLRPIPA